MERERLVRWDDPQAAVARLGEMDGLTYVRALQTGDLPLPPIAELLGFRIAVAEKGRVVIEAEPGEVHYNAIGSVHGGYAATLLDSAMGSAIQTMLPAGVRYTTLDVTAQFVRALSASTGTITVEGTVLHVGRRVATADGRIRDAGGRLCAHGTTTCMVL